MPKYYLYVEPQTRILAGPVSVCGLYAAEPLPTTHPKEWVDQALADHKLYFVHYYVWPDELDFDTLQRRTEAVCARLFFQSQTRATYHRLVKDVPYSYNYAIHYEHCQAHYRVAAYLCHRYRVNLITTHYALVYPEYSLTKHWGYRNNLHLEELLTHGPRTDFHHLRLKEQLVKYWSEQLLNGNPKYLVKPYPPKWWGSEEFFGNTISHLLDLTGTPEHQAWVKEESTLLKNNKAKLNEKKTRRGLLLHQWQDIQKNSTACGQPNLLH